MSIEMEPWQMKHGLQRAVFWWFNFDPYPSGLRFSKTGHGLAGSRGSARISATSSPCILTGSWRTAGIPSSPFGANQGGGGWRVTLLLSGALFFSYFFRGGQGFPFKLNQQNTIALFSHSHWASEVTVPSTKLTRMSDALNQL